MTDEHNTKEGLDVEGAKEGLDVEGAKEGLDVEGAKSFLDKLGEVLKKAKEIATGSGISLNKLLVIFAGVFGYHKRYDVYQWLVGLVAIISAAPLDRILDPAADFTTGVFCRYRRAVRLMLPMAIFGAVISIIMVLCGFTGQSFWRIVLFSEVVILTLAVLADYVFLTPLRRSIDEVSAPSDGHDDESTREALIDRVTKTLQRPFVRRTLGYLTIFTGILVFVHFVVNVVGNGDPLNAVLSGPFVLFASVIALLVILPVCWLAYKAAHMKIKGRRVSFVSDDKKFSSFFFEPILRTLFFIIGPIVTFKLLRIYALEPQYIFGAILAMIVLGIAAVRNSLIRKFLRFTTVKFQFVELIWVVALCAILILSPASGDQNTIFAAMRNAVNNIFIQPFVHTSVARPAGDVNGDLVTNEHDLRLMQAYFGDGKRIPDKSAIADCNLPWANVNGDDTIDITDLHYFMLAFPVVYNIAWDANRDSVINDADLDRLKEIVVFKSLPARDSVCGDVNYDFEVNETDVLLLTQELERRSDKLRFALLQSPKPKPHKRQSVQRNADTDSQYALSRKQDTVKQGQLKKPPVVSEQHASAAILTTKVVKKQSGNPAVHTQANISNSFPVAFTGDESFFDSWVEGISRRGELLEIKVSWNNPKPGGQTACVHRSYTLLECMTTGQKYLLKKFTGLPLGKAEVIGMGKSATLYFSGNIPIGNYFLKLVDFNGHTFEAEIVV